jgi:outer membrane protein assembly factor BamB
MKRHVNSIAWGLLLSLAWLLSPVDVMADGYRENNVYSDHAFPSEVIQREFSIPVSAATLMVVAPGAPELKSDGLSKALNEKLGIAVTWRRGDEVRAEELKGKDLIILGNISNNPWSLALYQRRRAFADAYFPGAGGWVITPARSVWDRERRVIVIGTSRDADLPAAFRAFLGKVKPGSRAIGPVRELKTALSFPKPPESVEPILAPTRKNLKTQTGPYWMAANWGFCYHLTGDTRWAKHFLAGMRALNDRAVESGQWVPETWTIVYFSLWKMILSWDLIAEDPLFSPADRRMIENLFWGYTKFNMALKDLDPGIALEGEMRQNHATFLTLGIYFMYRYYTERYDMKGLEPMIDKVRRSFDRGQAVTYAPNDDAGTYINYVPLHLMTYQLCEGEDSYIKSGKLQEMARLIAAVIDNRGETVTFGDVGGYSPKTAEATRGPELRYFSLAGWGYGDGRYRWLYDWNSQGKRLSLDNMSREGAGGTNPLILHFGGGDLLFALEDMYSGIYATDLKPKYPEEFTGIEAIPLDQASLSWVGRRSWMNDRIPRAGARYFHKIAFRRDFDARSEYLLLDGTSAFAHGHHDGNTVLRLTWKDRIWLFDMDYIKYTTKFHNGLTIARDGTQLDPPPVAELEMEADWNDTGVTRTTMKGMSGADWERDIVWRKGEWFLFLDRVRALGEGDYRLENRWRTRGKVTLEGNRLSVAQGEKSFYIKSADPSPRRLEFEPDGHRNDWSRYPYGRGGLDVLVAERRAPMGANETWTFASLMVASDGKDDPGSELLQADKDVYVVLPGAGKNGGWMTVTTRTDLLARSAFRTDARMALTTEREIYLLGATRIKTKGSSLASSTPFDVRIEFRDGAGELTVDDSNGAVVRSDGVSWADPGEGGNPGGHRLGAGRHRFHFHAAFDRLKNQSQDQVRMAETVMPSRPARPKVDFGMRARGSAGTAGVVQKAVSFGGGVLWGDDAGRITRFDGTEARELFRLPSAAKVVALCAADLDGDGNAEIVVGDVKENLYCFDAKGMRWEQKLTGYYGVDAWARDIAVRDIDGNGVATVLVANGGWKVSAIRADGKVRWESFTYFHPLTKVDVVETEKGRRYVVAGNEYHTPVNVIDPKDGGVIYHAWQQMGSESISVTDYFGIHLTAMQFVDTNGDGTRDIVFGTLSNHLFSINAADGRKIWEANTGDEVTAIGQFDDPQSREKRLAVATSAGDVFLYSPAGKRLQSASLGSRVTGMAVLEQSDPGRVDLAFSTRSGQVAVLDSELLMRGSMQLDDELIDVIPGARDGRFYELFAVGRKGAQTLRYEAAFLRKSWQY